MYLVHSTYTYVIPRTCTYVLCTPYIVLCAHKVQVIGYYTVCTRYLVRGTRYEVQVLPGMYIVPRMSTYLLHNSTQMLPRTSRTYVHSTTKYEVLCTMHIVQVHSTYLHSTYVQVQVSSYKKRRKNRGKRQKTKPQQRALISWSLVPNSTYWWSMSMR